jgi:hypothetical protein
MIWTLEHSTIQSCSLWLLILTACLLVRKQNLEASRTMISSLCTTGTVINRKRCHRKTPQADTALDALQHVSLVFTALFMLKLLMPVWAFRTA